MAGGGDLGTESAVERLVHELGACGPAHGLALVAVYPRAAETGLLEEQGRSLATVQSWLMTHVPAARVYRILWSQLAVITPALAPHEAAATLESATVLGSSPQIEVRALWVVLDVGAGVATLDDLQGEMSSRRNFGLAVGRPAVRVIDGRRFVG